MTDRLYADVEYKGAVYLDAELINDVWYVEDCTGGFHPFHSQKSVVPINAPQSLRRYPPEFSGHTRPHLQQ